MAVRFDLCSAVGFLQLLQEVDVNIQPAPLLVSGSLKAHTLRLQKPLPSNEYYLSPFALQAANDVAEPVVVPAPGLFEE